MLMHLRSTENPAPDAGFFVCGRQRAAGATRDPLSRGCSGLIAVLTLLSGCGSADPAQWRTGYVDDASLNEISAIAASRQFPDRFWVAADSGSPAMVWQIDANGAVHRSVTVDGAANRDWEDIALTDIDGRATLVIADIGDNLGNRDFASLYLLPEPVESVASATISRRIDFRYPDGPRDAEAITVDSAAGEILLLSKRDVPPRLYALPLDAAGAAVVTAEYRRDLDELPKPTSLDFALAHALKSWHWQPTAMDLDPDGKLAVLTYAGVYLIGSDGGVERSLKIAGLGIAEAISHSGDSVVITVEAAQAPVYRIPLTALRSQP